MADEITVKRRYDSPQRRGQAAATRRQILVAGQRLFESEGYPSTTMAQVAAEAGVSLKTVYLAFETKSGLLRALWQYLLGGADDDAPVIERGWYREVVDESDPEKMLRLNARNSRRVKSRAGAMMVVIRDAAPSDPDAASLWQLIQSDFHANQASIVSILARRKALRRGLGTRRASDLLWTLNHPDVWNLLVNERGWSPRQYEQWIATSACQQLLA